MAEKITRRALAKAETDALTRRVQQLEELLNQQSDGQTPLPTPISQTQPSCPPLPVSQVRNGRSEPQLSQMRPSTDVPEDSPASAKLSNRSDAEDQISVIRNLVPSPIRFDMSSGRVRYFGPTTNMNVLTASSHSGALERRETHWPIRMVVKDMAMETHDYLMELYWTCHNSVLHLVHSDAFYHDMERGGTQFYSLYLHLAILATGFKYADKSRNDVQRLATTGTAGSTLHEKARAFAKLELDGPGGIPSIQAFGLLADIEFNIGRDDCGWLFAVRCI
ncbi:hypothetical protein ACRE_090970 [Hapsidospora chrysogenum ATCC 11550]|uniref:Transcription factor domain-containing protein n=1 Tax=Hapsidospora chrysogenum (strain ATCC 11550 / CBS 779.69 / DSM 880 / IAM 14645 / JCM 23072 / IMI 49137) TaxID=857340 RepID=A0A086ST10_HAPC1|nr:hypothetical protein ACRE_090970 [Hapsidospora chrysogenum ATCC 11550]